MSYLLIPVGRGEALARVDEGDYDELVCYRWRLHPGGYAQRTTPRPHSRSILMHQQILGHKGVDHRNRNKLDNRRSNLRPATAAQNAQNKSGVLRGVTFDRFTGRWKAQAGLAGRHIFLGRYDTSGEAAAAAASWRAKHMPYSEDASMA